MKLKNKMNSVTLPALLATVMAIPLAASLTVLSSSNAMANEVNNGNNNTNNNSNNNSNATPVMLNDLLGNNISTSGSKEENEVPAMRREALIEIASSVGMSAGLMHQLKIEKAEIERNQKNLDQLFNFSKVMLQDGVLSPVLTEGRSNYSQHSDDEVRVNDITYKIEAPARFISTDPSFIWRNYLKFPITNYERPHSAYLPKNAGEKQIWDQWVKKGWDQGELQAKNIRQASYGRLERDFDGMLNYKLLLKQGLITPTIVAKANLGVTGGGKEMAINDQVFRIQDHSSLIPKVEDWKTQYPVTHEGKTPNK